MILGILTNRMGEIKVISYTEFPSGEDEITNVQSSCSLNTYDGDTSREEATYSGTISSF